ncbi:DUF3618 domain-containing protein [Aeromicrobium sp. PE09-221]|uniref:DUF3618 domain-containing protein n=1 Tax=Aeromicrobium sp. PE09-221 TaxID=1898043 RepID=UPI000B3EE225|nr:DUF3618 domain-containing protein [Aeromicrobium sp. PE09-221]
MTDGPNERHDVSEASPDQLVDEIEDIRIRLAGTIDELIDRSNPKNVARRQLAKVKARFVAPDGSVRVENVVPVVAITVAVVGGIVVVRRLLS